MLLSVSKHYLWQCVRAARDERLRRKYEISRTALANLPMEGWFQQGRRWVITESDLLRQIRRSRNDNRSEVTSWREPHGQTDKLPPCHSPTHTKRSSSAWWLSSRSFTTRTRTFRSSGERDFSSQNTASFVPALTLWPRAWTCPCRRTTRVFRSTSCSFVKFKSAGRQCGRSSSSM